MLLLFYNFYCVYYKLFLRIFIGELKKLTRCLEPFNENLTLFIKLHGSSRENALYQFDALPFYGSLK